MKRTPIRKVSKKQSSRNRLYSQTRKQFLTENPFCMARVNDQCTTQATDVHHKKGREGDLLVNTAYFLPVCRHCHTYIELNPAEAREKGWSLSRLAV